MEIAMTWKNLLSLCVGLMIFAAAGCTYSPHYDHHARGSYREVRVDHYGGYDRCDDHHGH
jgi:hypothetical protein